MVSDNFTVNLENTGKRDCLRENFYLIRLVAGQDYIRISESNGGRVRPTVNYVMTRLVALTSQNREAGVTRLYPVRGETSEQRGYPASVTASAEAQNMDLTSLFIGSNEKTAGRPVSSSCSPGSPQVRTFPPFGGILYQPVVPARTTSSPWTWRRAPPGACVRDGALSSVCPCEALA